MRGLLRLAAWLYPPDWRARYGAEFDALLEDAGAGWRELRDVLKGAILMRFTSRSFAITLAVCGGLGLVAACAIAFRLQDNYISTAVVRMGPGATPQAARERLGEIQHSLFSRSSLSAMIQTLDLYPEERKTLPLEDIVQDMRNRHIAMLPLRNGPKTAPLRDAFEIQFSYPEREKAQLVTRELTSRVIAGGTPVVSFEVLDPASLPQKPSYPNLGMMVLMGLAVGLAVGIVVAGIRRRPVVALCGVAGAVLAGALSFTIPNTWVSTAVVRVNPPQAAASVAARVHQSGGGIEMRELPGKTGIVMVQSKGHDRFEAQSAAQSFLTRMVPDNGANITSIEVLDPASFPQQPSSPNRLSIMLLGLTAGLLLGALGRFLRRPPAQTGQSPAPISAV